MNRLSVKLSLLFVGIALLSVGITAIWVNQSVRADFASYCQRSCEMGTCPGNMATNGMTGVAEQRFLEDFQRSLLVAGLVAVVVAIALGFTIGSIISWPMSQLASSARKIASGDLTQRVTNGNNDEIGEVSSAFNVMAEQLEKKEKSRKQLLADIAHELRNPLSIVQGNLEAWLDGVITPTAEQYASVYDETVLLNRLITDLRELSLAEAGQLKLHLEKTDISQLVDSEVEVFQARCRDKDVSLTADVETDTPQVNIDRDRVRQVLHNLLENALRYTPAKGSIKVQVIKQDAERVLVTVADSGSGIAPADLPLVFDHFYKADKSRQRGYGGAGIGLALVKKYIELHGGRVWVESVLEKGSTFYFVV
jgi:signal transduction histidine kinase